MRILIMDSGRGIRGEKVALWRERLGLEPDDDVALLSWYPPAEPLPVVAHLVAGPALHLGREPRRVPTLAEAGLLPGDALSDAAAAVAAGADARDADDPWAGAADGDGSGEMYGDEISEQYAEPDSLAIIDADVEDELAEQDTLAQSAETEAAAAMESAARVAHLPKQHPQRLAHGVRWRTNRVRLQVRGGYRRGRARARAAHRRGAQWPSQALRSLLRLRGSGIANEFALSVSRSRAAAEIFAGADVVVPVDDLSSRSAWILARRVEGPDVVVTFHAAARRIAQVRLRAQ